MRIDVFEKSHNHGFDFAPQFSVLSGTPGIGGQIAVYNLYGEVRWSGNHFIAVYLHYPTCVVMYCLASNARFFKDVNAHNFRTEYGSRFTTVMAVYVQDGAIQIPLQLLHLE